MNPSEKCIILSNEYTDSYISLFREVPRTAVNPVMKLKKGLVGDFSKIDHGASQKGGIF